MIGKNSIPVSSALLKCPSESDSIFMCFDHVYFFFRELPTYFCFDGGLLLTQSSKLANREAGIRVAEWASGPRAERWAHSWGSREGPQDPGMQGCSHAPHFLLSPSSPHSSCSSASSFCFQFLWHLFHFIMTFK